MLEMDQTDTERSLNTIYGEGYVYMGPLTPQHYQILSKVKQDMTNSDNDNEYQFKVMLLGDSGVGKFEISFPVCLHQFSS